MFGLTTLGLFHTVIGLITLVYGVIALLKYKQIAPANREGQIYLLGTVVAAATGLGIFQHGGFGPPHVLSLLTLAAVAVGTVAALTPLFGKFSAYVQAVSYSATFLFHMIPGVTETSTRLPAGKPLFASAEAPGLQAVYGVLLLVFVVGLVWQVRWLRATPR
jgi:uncharacterized membrane protein